MDIYVCVCLGSISSLMHISSNNINIFCLHIFVYFYFWNSVFRQECCAIELESERCIVSRLDVVVDVKQTYIQLFSEI